MFWRAYGFDGSCMVFGFIIGLIIIRQCLSLTASGPLTAGQHSFESNLSLVKMSSELGM